MKHPNRQYSNKALKLFQATGLPKGFKAAAKTNNYEIQMYDIIGSEACNSKTVADALAEANGDPVTIRMSSPGGSVFEGLTIFNQIKNYKGDTNLIVDGVCASIASVLALAADHVETAKNSLWMTHNAWLYTVGNAASLRADAVTLDKIDNIINGVYTTKTGKDAEIWQHLMAEETWFTANEAVAMGLADMLSEDEPTEEKTGKLSHLYEQKFAQHAVSKDLRAEMKRALRIRRALVASYDFC